MMTLILALVAWFYILEWLFNKIDKIGEPDSRHAGQPPPRSFWCLLLVVVLTTAACDASPISPSVDPPPTPMPVPLNCVSVPFPAPPAEPYAYKLVCSEAVRGKSPLGPAVRPATPTPTPPATTVG